MSRMVWARLSVVLFAAVVINRRCDAHFAWLAVDQQDRPIAFFGESPTDRVYKQLPCVAEATVRQATAQDQARDADLPVVEEDEFLGRRGASPLKSGVLRAEITYGIYNGMKLTYHACYVADAGDFPSTAAAAAKVPLALSALPRLREEKLEILVAWQGKPAPDLKVQLLLPDAESLEAKTNEEGVAEFPRPEAGLAGCLIERLDGKASGEIDGHAYSNSADYATLSFVVPAAPGRPVPARTTSRKSPPANVPSTASAAAGSTLPTLPEPVSSFGGAFCDGKLYVYSGHIGEEHAHSRDNLSTHFRRLDLTAPQQWEELPMQTPLQGLPLVSWGGKVYRVGGLAPQNAAGEKEDLRSVAEFACYDPAANSWTTLPALPEERSSHDAAVVGGVLYVVGGWRLAGASPGTWLDTAWSFDLNDPQAAWRPLPSPPFQRRALAVVAWGDKLVALGGMDAQKHVSRRADLFDPASQSWTRLPDLPGRGMQGFGLAAWSEGDRLLASGTDPVIWRLAPGAAAWTEAGALSRGRFFHRLLPRGNGVLLAVAGASMEDGHLATIESVDPAP